MVGRIYIHEPMRVGRRRLSPLVVRIEGFGEECPPSWRGYKEITVTRWPPRHVWIGLHLALYLGLRRYVERIVAATNETMAAHLEEYEDAPTLYAEEHWLRKHRRWPN
jgi:hypothetical protein